MDPFRYDERSPQYHRLRFLSKETNSVEIWGWRARRGGREGVGCGGRQEGGRVAQDGARDSLAAQRGADSPTEECRAAATVALPFRLRE